MESEAPLASRIRPRTLDEIVGQQHILAKDKLLYRAIKADKLSSVIFYGPPGTGKTTIAKVIAGSQLLYAFFGTQILQELFVLQFVFFLFTHIVLLVLITNAE